MWFFYILKRGFSGKGQESMERRLLFENPLKCL